MKLSIQGNRLYADNYILSHCEVEDGHRDKSFSGEVSTAYSHYHSRNLPKVDGLGWVGADHKVSVVLGRVVKSDGEVIPCQLTEARLMGILERNEEMGGRATLEISGVSDA